MVVAQEQGVAIGRGGLEGLRRNLPARARLVVDHHRVAQLVLEALTEDARNRVGATARWKAHQDAGGGLRLGQAERADHTGGQQRTTNQGWAGK